MIEKIKSIIKQSADIKYQFLENEEQLKLINKIVEGIVHSLKNKKRIYFCGNGGSAADAQHLAAELSGRFYSDRPALAAEAMHCNTSYLTAVANDYSYEVIYQRMIEGFGTEGDVIIGLSTSGNSKNIILALEAANKKNMITVGLTGSSGGLMKNICKYCLTVPSNDTPRIQECHILLGHIICQLVEERYF